MLFQRNAWADAETIMDWVPYFIAHARITNGYL